MLQPGCTIFVQTLNGFTNNYVVPGPTETIQLVYFQSVRPSYYIVIGKSNRDCID